MDQAKSFYKKNKSCLKLFKLAMDVYLTAEELPYAIYPIQNLFIICSSKFESEHVEEAKRNLSKPVPSSFIEGKKQ